MEYRGSEWEEEKTLKRSKQQNRDFEEKLQNFIVVMKNVYSNNNKRKLYQYEHSDMASHYRLKSSGLVVRPEKRFKMETSTPISYRRQPEILPDSSPLGQVTTPVDMSITKTSSEGGSLEEGIGGSSSNGSLMNRSMNNLQVTTPMKEEDVMILAKTTITANEFHDSSEAFRKRTSSLPKVMIFQMKTFGSMMKEIMAFKISSLRKRDMTTTSS